MLKIYLYVLAEMLLMSLMRKEQTNTQLDRVNCADSAFFILKLVSL